MILKNAGRRIDASAILLSYASMRGISNSTKSSFYRSASILLYSTIEGLTYELVRKSTANIGHIIGDKTEHIEKHKIPLGVFNTKNDHCLCEKVKKPVLIDDDGVTFGKLNNYLKNNSIISSEEYMMLDWTRKERNKLHLQGLRTADTGYTKAKINKAGETLDFLIKKVNSLP